MARSRNSKGLTRVEVLVVALVSVFVLSLLSPAFRRAKSDAERAVCASNLATLGKAMRLYAMDYENAFPRAGGRTSDWGDAVRWNAPNRYQAYGLSADGSGGSATISSCFYLLVKYTDLAPRYFVCPGDTGTTEFQPPAGAGLPRGFRIIDAWDFGPEAYSHCSYAYHLPFGLYALTTSHDSGMPLAADRNPWLRSPGHEAHLVAGFKPDLPAYKGTAEQARRGNSLSHKGDGQNVLFIDGHVAFEERSYCGLDNDNIYLISADPTQGSPLGWVPAPGMATPTNRKDSVLVHDPVPALLAPPEVANVDSRNLKGTVVVATPDCPLPEHKNAIWCATFQMAWDKFKQDIIGEPIQVPAAQELADRLNRSPFPTGSIEDESYYAVAGAVKSGLIEQIQKEMKRRFPSEPVPVFDSRYRTLPAVMLAYAYLTVGIEFERPFYGNPNAFDFLDSAGARTSVTTFRAQTGARDERVDRVREQVEVLYYDDGQPTGGTEFAVDLSNETGPYQVVLACLPRSNTLGEAAKVLQSKIAGFRNGPDYEVLRKFQPADILIVPDIAYKLTHHFDELLNKHFGNHRWREYFFFEALQKIDFTLSRTGVVLKSEARLAATRGVSRDEQKPRHFRFDRPFLICVQKREPNATPFFLMWVDNAELMKPYAGSEKGK
jgi:prepilin-type processing-associated H-X9-DG protein